MYKQTYYTDWLGEPGSCRLFVRKGSTYLKSFTRFWIEEFHKREIVFRSEKRTRLNCNCVYILGINQSFLSEEQMQEAHVPHPSHETHFFAINEVMVINEGWLTSQLPHLEKGLDQTAIRVKQVCCALKWLCTSFEQIWIFKSPLPTDSFWFWKKWFFNVFNFILLFCYDTPSPRETCASFRLSKLSAQVS